MISVRLQRQRARDVDALALAARQLVRVALGKTLRRQAHARQQVARARHRFGARRAVHLRREGDAVLDGQARVQRRVAVLEHHLHLAAVVLQRPSSRPPTARASKTMSPLSGSIRCISKPRGGALAAARFADHAQRLALVHCEADAIDRAHHAAAAAQHVLLQREVLDEALTAGVSSSKRAARRALRGTAHCLISIAERMPSDSRLKAIEVKKIITPGSAAIHGCT